jgi:hypothetical protein
MTVCWQVVPRKKRSNCGTQYIIFKSKKKVKKGNLKFLSIFLCLFSLSIHN